ncbi:MAG: response regulator [Chloroflexi bacterium]|nr:response regulator [Chloroflexota bacterium]
MEGTLEGASVVIVEDDLPLLEVTKEVLEVQGCRVRAFDSAPPAIQSLSASAPDLLIVDLGLPGINGLTLIERAHDIDPMLPILVITAWQTAQSAISAADLGVTGYLRKPAPTDRVVAAAKRALGIRQFERRIRSQDSARAAEVARNDAVRKIADSIPHELHQPLSVILGYASLLRDEDAIRDSELRSYVDEIISAGRRLKDLILRFSEAQVYTTREFGANQVFDVTKAATLSHHSAPEREA